MTRANVQSSVVLVVIMPYWDLKSCTCNYWHSNYFQCVCMFELLLAMNVAQCVELLLLRNSDNRVHRVYAQHRSHQLVM